MKNREWELEMALEGETGFSALAPGAFSTEADIGLFSEIWRRKELMVFDFDGTLLDSMGMWEHIGPDYLRSQGITPPEDLTDTIFQYTVDECYDYFVSVFGIAQSIDEYRRDVYAMVMHRYTDELQLKNGALDFVQKTAGAGKQICILTNTGRECVEPAMRRLGLDTFIRSEHLFTCKELGMDKQTSAIYLRAAKLMGCDPQNAVCFEDTSFAVKNAKQAGYTVCAVFDAASDKEADRKMIAEYTDIRVPDLSVLR